MAGRGPAPKTQRARARDTAARQQEMTVLVDDGTLYGPELPEGVLPDGGDWHPQTRALWDALRRNPLLADEPEMGWQFLIDTALMHTVMWAKGKWEFASEVRLRLGKVGATPEDRQRLRLSIQTPEQVARAETAAAETPADTTSRRRNMRIVG